MAKPFTDWTILPHGKPTRLDENLLTVTGVLRMPPMGDVERRMTVVRLRDGRLVVYSAIALDEADNERPRTVRDADLSSSYRATSTAWTSGNLEGSAIPR